jgi:diguanylate cyclase (GGDEF)-like protein/hemerythrin-like metal-binding protein/PAS domain S-box-containing protein
MSSPALNVDHSWFKQLFELSPDPTWIIDGNQFVECNEAAVRTLGYASREELLNVHPSWLSPDKQPDGEASFTKAERMMALAKENGLHRFEWIHTKADRSDFVAEVTLSIVNLANRQVIYCVWRDITDRKLAENKLLRSETLLRTLYDSTSDAIMLLTEHGFFGCNSATLKIFGCKAQDEFSGRHPADLSPPSQPCGTDSMTLAKQRIATAIKEGSLRFEWMHRRADNGQSFPAEVLLNSMELDGEHVLQAVVRDITERKQMEDQIRQMAYHDPLTNLPNRRLLNDRLTHAIAASKRSGCHGALLFLDLDNFKPLNDIHGHEVGDLLLIEAAERLKTCVRELDTVARFGGDEFVVMIVEISPDRSEAMLRAEIVADKIRTALSEPYFLTVKRKRKSNVSVRHCCTASIGVTLFDNSSTSADILRSADTAMYDAKESGRNAVRFTPGIPEPVGTRRPDLANFVQLTWRPGYECGNATLDAQHRALFNGANTLLTAVLCGRRTENIAALIDTLIRDFAQHFRDEEAIITAAGFPGATNHAAMHRQLVDSAVGLVARFHAGTLGLGELFQFLAHDMVARHLLGADREFFPYLK